MKEKIHKNQCGKEESNLLVFFLVKIVKGPKTKRKCACFLGVVFFSDNFNGILYKFCLRGADYVQVQ